MLDVYREWKDNIEERASNFKSLRSFASQNIEVQLNPLFQITGSGCEDKIPVFFILCAFCHDLAKQLILQDPIVRISRSSKNRSFWHFLGLFNPEGIKRFIISTFDPDNNNAISLTEAPKPTLVDVFGIPGFLNVFLLQNGRYPQLSWETKYRPLYKDLLDNKKERSILILDAMIHLKIDIINLTFNYRGEKYEVQEILDQYDIFFHRGAFIIKTN